MVTAGGVGPSRYFASICIKNVSVGQELKIENRDRGACSNLVPSLLACEMNKYRNNGRCEFCRPGYVCGGGGTWNSIENYFEDTEPTLCSEHHWCGDEAWTNTDPPRIPPGKQWKNSNGCENLKGTYRKDTGPIMHGTQKGRYSYVSTCCTDQKGIKGIDCSDVSCQMSCPKGYFANEERVCTGKSDRCPLIIVHFKFVLILCCTFVACGPGYICPDGTNNKIKFCPKNHFCGGFDGNGKVLAKSDSKPCPGNSAACSERHDGVIKNGKSFIKVCNCGPGKCNNGNTVGFIIDAPGMSKWAKCPGLAECKGNEIVIDQSCLCKKNYYRPTANCGCVACSPGLLCAGFAPADPQAVPSRPQILKEKGKYVNQDGTTNICNLDYEADEDNYDEDIDIYDPNLRELPCDGHGYYKIQSGIDADWGVYNSVCCLYSTIRYDWKEFTKDFDDKQIEEAMRSQCVKGSCQTCPMHYTRLNGVCAKCLGSKYNGVYCPGGGEWEAGKKYTKDVEPRACRNGYSCNNGTETQCEPRSACGDIGFYKIDGHENSRKKYVKAHLRKSWEKETLIMAQSIDLQREDSRRKLDFHPSAVDDSIIFEDHLVRKSTPTLIARKTTHKERSSLLVVEPEKALPDNISNSVVDPLPSISAPYKTQNFEANSKPTPNQEPTSTSDGSRSWSGSVARGNWTAGIRFYFPGYIGDQVNDCYVFLLKKCMMQLPNPFIAPFPGKMGRD